MRNLVFVYNSKALIWKIFLKTVISYCNSKGSSRCEKEWVVAMRFLALSVYDLKMVYGLSLAGTNFGLIQFFGKKFLEQMLASNAKAIIHGTNRLQTHTSWEQLTASAVQRPRENLVSTRKDAKYTRLFVNFWEFISRATRQVSRIAVQAVIRKESSLWS